MNVGSLFSGIGGFDLGLERAGMRTAWFCEQDEFCQRALAEHWPGVPCYPDVSKLRGGDVEPVDLLCGGFPCQGLSDAGLRLGFADPRSGLWSEFARLIGEVRPRYVVVENVAALLRRGLGRVLGDLAEIGYDAEWDCIRAADVGAPHSRDRIWIVAYPSRNAQARTEAPAGAIGERTGPGGQPAHVADTEVVAIGSGLRESEPGAQRGGRSGDGRGAGVLADAESSASRAGGQALSGHRERDFARSTSDWRTRGSGRGSGTTDVWDSRSEGLEGQWTRGAVGNPDWWLTEPEVGRVADGVPDRVDQLSALGNALVPAIAYQLGRDILAYEEGRLAA